MYVGYACICIYLPYYNFVLPFFAAATALLLLLLRWRCSTAAIPQVNSAVCRLCLRPAPPAQSPTCAPPPHVVDVAVAVGVAGKKVLKSAPLCRCDVSLSLTIARLSRDLVLSAESSTTIFFSSKDFHVHFFFYKIKFNLIRNKRRNSNKMKLFLCAIAVTLCVAATSE